MTDKAQAVIDLAIKFCEGNVFFGEDGQKLQDAIGAYKASGSPVPPRPITAEEQAVIKAAAPLRAFSKVLDAAFVAMEGPSWPDPPTNHYVYQGQFGYLTPPGAEPVGGQIIPLGARRLRVKYEPVAQ